MLTGVEGVIDKDHATSLLAKNINADLMVITTGTRITKTYTGKPVWT